MKIIVSGVGCCLVDLLYNDIDFSSETFRPFISLKRGDGGLTPGHLVFNEEFTEFAGSSFDVVLNQITGGRTPDKKNIGGPSIVSLIHAAQLTDPENCEIRFYGRGGNDENGRYLISALQKTPVILHDYQLTEKSTPSTVVLSDPTFDHGHGERIFINSAYGIVWEEVNKSIDYDMTEFIKNKVIEVINGLSNYSVFRDKNNYGDKDSIAQTYLNQYVEENKNIINEKVIEIMQGLDSNAIRDQLYDLIYQVVEDRIVGKKET